MGDQPTATVYDAGRLVTELNAGGGIGLSFTHTGSQVYADLTDEQYKSLKSMAQSPFYDNINLRHRFLGDVQVDLAHMPINPATGQHMLIINNVHEAANNPKILQSFKDTTALSRAVVAGNFDGAIHEAHALEAREVSETVQRLSRATGLSVTYVHPAEGLVPTPGFFKLQIPPGADREKFVDDFIAVRDRVGLSRETLSIADSTSSLMKHDPTAFYIPNDGKVTEDALRKLEAASGEFHALLPHNGPQAGLQPSGQNYGTLKKMSYDPAVPAFPVVAPTSDVPPAQSVVHTGNSANVAPPPNPRRNMVISI